LSFTEGMPMDVAPHPHMGLQTVTWRLEGEVVHDDSLGEEAVLRPGGVTVMTSAARSRCGQTSNTPSSSLLVTAHSMGKRSANAAGGNPRRARRLGKWTTFRRGEGVLRDSDCTHRNLCAWAAPIQ
jgi:hypothetical protein